jgi:hypothetical protein
MAGSSDMPGAGTILILGILAIGAYLVYSFVSGVGNIFGGVGNALGTAGSDITGAFGGAARAISGGVGATASFFGGIGGDIAGLFGVGGGGSTPSTVTPYQTDYVKSLESAGITITDTSSPKVISVAGQLQSVSSSLPPAQGPPVSSTLPNSQAYYNQLSTNLTARNSAV